MHPLRTGSTSSTAAKPAAEAADCRASAACAGCRLSVSSHPGPRPILRRAFSKRHTHSYSVDRTKRANNENVPKTCTHTALHRLSCTTQLLLPVQSGPTMKTYQKCVCMSIRHRVDLVVQHTFCFRLLPVQSKSCWHCRCRWVNVQFETGLAATVLVAGQVQDGHERGHRVRRQNKGARQRALCHRREQQPQDIVSLCLSRPLVTPPAALKEPTSSTLTNTRLAELHARAGGMAHH